MFALDLWLGWTESPRELYTPAGDLVATVMLLRGAQGLLQSRGTFLAYIISGEIFFVGLALHCAASAPALGSESSLGMVGALLAYLAGETAAGLALAHVGASEKFSSGNRSLGGLRNFW